MTLFSELDELGITPTWCLVLVALQWPAEAPLLAPREAQMYAAQILTSSSEHENLVLEVAAATPPERDHTIDAVMQLAAATDCSVPIAERTLLLVLLTRELARWDSSRPTETLPRLMDVWALADWPNDMPPTIRQWQDGTISPPKLFSTEGCESLQHELREWIVEQVHGVRGGT